MWKIFPSVLLALASTAHADRDPFVLSHPQPDEVRASEFFTKWPGLAKIVNERDLNPLLFPGGDACDVPQSATTGRFSESSVSPDGKQLAVITAVNVDAKVAKKLGMDGGTGIAVVAILFDGPARKIAAFELPNGRNCDRPDVGMTWVGGEVILVESKSGPPYAAILEARTPGIRVEDNIWNPSFSPGRRHIAGLNEYSLHQTYPSGEALQIDNAVAWGSTDVVGEAVTNVAWSSDTRLTFCGSKPKEAAMKYQAELVADAKPKITSLGPCPSAAKP